MKIASLIGLAKDFFDRWKDVNKKEIDLYERKRHVYATIEWKHRIA